MGYRIVYGQVREKNQKVRRPKARLQTLTALWLLVFALTVKCWWPEGAEKLRQLLLPESISGTQLALETMVTDLRDGISFSDALTAFCTEIIAHEANS